MVKETRIIFELGDILQMRIVCSHCRGEVVHSKLKPNYRLPANCPNCNEEWWDPNRQDNLALGYFKAMLDSIHRLQQCKDGGNVQFTVKFEIEGEADK